MSKPEVSPPDATPVLSMRDRTSGYDVAPDIIDVAATLHWYALQVPPQKEFVAQKILRRYGLKTFVPVRTEFRHSSKKSRHLRLPKQPVRFAVAPRYVLAGFEPGRPLWFNLFALPCISGAVGIDGAPIMLPTKEVVKLIRRTATGVNAPEAQRFMRTHHEFGVGDDVRVVDGPFEGMVVPVVGIAQGLARLEMKLFGGAVDDVRVPLDYLEAA
ncbi:transcription termination/antitermination protein NusG [Aurantimonas endophytica]|uniref:Transcription antitermination factor NusG n=1 Tax=Aurantimonas endophytica TaxID=1522175 RepID=A0A7W6HFZ8_9HYPH|nr:transcription termination/antitermination NusG family protein [Aurantimonas endophytica]MBB4004466.1 transcription antitermination factor NusG [Aurantimonas endophytica]MCO6405302.1 hypothetical protein [Aurantimonas endophytica]